MNRNKALLSVNFSVFLFGMAGLFAKFIMLPAIAITFGRVLFSSLALLIFCVVRHQELRLKDRRHFIILLLAGVVLALHWWSFLKSIQMSSVAIGTITFATFPLFATFFEPIVFKEKLKMSNVIMAFLILVGIGITFPDFNFNNQMTLSIVIGLFSAFSYAVLTLFNRYLSTVYESTVVAMYEQITAVFFLLPFAVSIHAMPTVIDLCLLIFLGVFTTALAHSLFIGSLKTISAQLAGIISSLEAVYGIVLAFIVLGEIPAIREIVGGIVIVSVAIAGQVKGKKDRINNS
ncbi:DMT family transporter [Fusibacter ferrireducens]|uniref:DMT family transporter n=1 Tax=Fusibacter ferrireducens TaxID=2785058 RepID=A0ABR9ZW24_9FIRM|nr:DMT family transporter [Fusibacter ferrireducens]MBF4694661.1 DMT family transporter [Fusibacter ferrireducens]